MYLLGGVARYECLFPSPVLDNSAYRFRVDNRYLFVSRKNDTGHKEADSKSRRLYVASDYGSQEVKFSEVQLPSLKDEQVHNMGVCGEVVMSVFPACSSMLSWQLMRQVPSSMLTREQVRHVVGREGTTG